MSLDKLSKEFKSVAEWASYCKSLESGLIKLTKEINSLKEKNEQLENIIKQTTPIIETEEQKRLKQTILDVSDEEAIAIMELAKLKEISLQRDLNADECRRYDIYTKSLLSIREKGKKRPSSGAEPTDEELLSRLEADNGNS